MNDVIIITGPTASGKTAVSINLAKILDGEIIGADSMQVYKGMDIGTAKPTEDEKDRIIHHLIDIIHVNENFNVAKYKEITHNAIKGVIKKNKIPLVVGGTGLYIDALLYNIDFSKTNGNIKLRQKYERILEKKGKEYLYELLKERDPKACDKIHPNNTRRVIRSLEILDNENENLDEVKKNAVNKSPFKFHLFILFPERQYLYQRIEKRVDQMIEDGLIDEVKRLLKKGGDISLTALQAIGYKEVIWYLRGCITRKEMITILKRNTRRYAKRQFTWFKKYENGYRIKVNRKDTADDVVNEILKILEKNGIRK